MTQRRDYDLYDPLALRKEERIKGPDDPRLQHESNLQKFAGEDAERIKRIAAQQKQMKTWSALGVRERELGKHKEALENKAFEDYQKNVAIKALQLQQAVEQARLDQAKRDLAENERLAAEKTERLAKQKEQETELNIKDIVNQLTGKLLTETDVAEDE